MVPHHLAEKRQFTVLEGMKERWFLSCATPRISSCNVWAKERIIWLRKIGQELSYLGRLRPPKVVWFTFHHWKREAFASPSIELLLMKLSCNTLEKEKKRGRSGFVLENCRWWVKQLTNKGFKQDLSTSLKRHDRTVWSDRHRAEADGWLRSSLKTPSWIPKRAKTERENRYMTIYTTPDTNKVGAPGRSGYLPNRSRSKSQKEL